MKTPKKVTTFTYETNCTEIKKSEWDKLMKNATRANKTIINGLVKTHLPDLFNDLVLNFPNPYNYFKTNTHIILVHSAIEYFIRYK